MSLAFTLPSSRSFDVCRSAHRDAAPAGIGLPEILIKIGGFLAGASLLIGTMLFNMGALTLFWVKLLPVPACSGGALLSLGVLIVCIRELRKSPDTPILQTRAGNPV